MRTVIAFTFATMVGTSAVVLASLLLPKFTAKPQHPVLKEVRGMVLGTQAGQSAAELLGVADGSREPLNLSDTVSSITGVVTSSIEQKAQQIVSDQVAAQVVKQYEQLPAPQQDRVTEMICKSNQ